MRWQVIHRAAPYLTKAMVDENFDFFAHTLAGQEEQLPRWRRCTRAADRDLGEALGQAYVDRAFPPDSKARTIEMVHAIERAMHDDIESRDLDDACDQGTGHRQAEGNRRQDRLSLALARLFQREDHARQLSANVGQASSFEFERWVAKIGKPVDRGEWTMTPPTINAYYDPQLNTINFPAGILQPPFFDPTTWMTR